MNSLSISDWSALARRFARKPFLSAPIQLQQDAGDTVLSLSKAKALPGCFILMLAGIALICVGQFVIEPNPGSFHSAATWIGTALDGAVCLAGLIALGWVLTFTRQIVLMSQTRRVSLRTGRGVEELSFPSGELQVRLVRATPRTNTIGSAFRNAANAYRNTANAYRLELLLTARPDEPIFLAKARRHEGLQSAYRAIARHVGAATDLALQQVQLPDGTTVGFCIDPVGNSGANFRICKLVVRSAEFAEVVPTIGVKVFWTVFLLFGIGGIVAGLTIWNFGGFIPLIVGGVFLTFGTLGVAGVMGPRRVSFDLAAGVVTIRGGKMAVPELATGLPIDRLAALQVCYYMTGGNGEDSSPYPVFELNAALTQPQDTRFTIMNDCDRGRLFKQAGQLRDLLGLPLFDHTGS